MAAESFWGRIDGVPFAEIGTLAPATFETLADGGCGAASVQFTLSTRAAHRALRKGVRFELLVGPQPLYTGCVTEFDRQSGTVHAAGMAAMLYRYLALDGTGASTRDIGTAVAQAVARGWLGGNPHAVDGTADGDDTGTPLTVGALLDAYCEQIGARWGCDERGDLYIWTRPTEPNWLVAPDGAVFGDTNEDSPTRLAGRYDDGTPPFKTAYAGADGLEADKDLTDRGVLTEAQAVGILEGMLVRKEGTSWVNAATLTSGQIATLGDSPAFLPMVRGGHLMRSFGVGYLDLGAMTLDTVIGKTSYTFGSPTITVEPLNTAPRTFRDVVAAS